MCFSQSRSSNDHFSPLNKNLRYAVWKGLSVPLPVLDQLTPLGMSMPVSVSLVSQTVGRDVELILTAALRGMQPSSCSRFSNLGSYFTLLRADKTFLWYIPEIIVHWEVCTWRKYQEGRARIIYLTFLSKLLDVKSSCKCISTLQMSIVGSNKIIKTSRTNEKWNSTLFCKHSHKYYLSNWKFPSAQASVHHDL